MHAKVNNPNHPVILFIPEAGIYPYIRGLAFLGDAVVKNGGKVFITQDSGQMIRSPIMDMYRIPANTSKKKTAFIYRITDKHIRTVTKKYSFSKINLSDMVDNEIVNEIDKLVNNAGKNPRNVVFRGFPVGRMAEYDFVLVTKYRYYSNLSKNHLALYTLYVKNAALAIALVDKICMLYKPSLFLTFNEYAQCQAVKFSALKNNVRYMALTYPVHFNIDASKFSVWESTYPSWRYTHIQNWKKWRKIPIRKEAVLDSWADSVFRMYGSGSHIFSPRKKKDPDILFKNLKLNTKRKTIVVYTSSQDERFCSDLSMEIWSEKNCVHDVFKDQIEWLLWLKNYSKKHKNVQVIVRIHPRESSGKEGKGSQYLIKLKANFKKNTDNFYLIWPNDPVSSYDLLELADICLVSWSLMGQEAARVGIPVLSHTSNMFYPDDNFIQIAHTRKEYKTKLNIMLKSATTWENLVMAIRFYHWRTFIPALNFKDTIPADFDDHGVWPKVPKSMVKAINDILTGKQNLIKYNIQKWQKNLPTDSTLQETLTIKAGIRRLIDKIFYPSKDFGVAYRLWRYICRKLKGDYLWIPKENYKDYHLKYLEDLSSIKKYILKTKKDPNLRVIFADGLYSLLIRNGSVTRRMSPMVNRLAKLHESV